MTKWKEHFLLMYLPLYTKSHIDKYLIHLEACKMSPSILAIANWVAWACACSNSSFWFSSSNSICLITNFFLIGLCKQSCHSFPKFYFVSLNINRTFRKFVHGFYQVINISNQCLFARWYFARNLEQFARNVFWVKRRSICTFLWCINKSFKQWHISYLLIIWGCGCECLSVWNFMFILFDNFCNALINPSCAPSPLPWPSIIVVICVHHDHVNALCQYSLSSFRFCSWFVLLSNDTHLTIDDGVWCECVSNVWMPNKICQYASILLHISQGC